MSTGVLPPNPFPGLRPFREDEETLFFGREAQVDAMVDKLAATRLMDSVKHMLDIQRVGKAFAERHVSVDQLRGFC